MSADPSLGLRGAPNTRDLGGYRTADGWRTRFGLLYRSGELSKLTDADVDVLSGLNLRTVVDFRIPEEVTFGGVDRLPDGLTPVSLPVGGGGLDGFYRLARSDDWELIHRALGDGNGEQSMAEVYRGFVVTDLDREGFAAALRTIVEAETLPLLFHCTAGKDRAGWLAAIVLRILGVNRDELMNDFLLSNMYFLSAADELMRSLGVSEAHSRMFRPVLAQQPAYLDAAFEAADTMYGSFEAFVHRGLNVERPEVDALRSRLLEPVPA